MKIAGPLGISMARDGSGTSWLPDMTPMYAVHRQAGSWGLMGHGNLFLQYIDEPGPRGDDDVGSVHWVMGMAHRNVGGGPLTFRAMLSLEPATVGKCGYPDLLASGETCNGEPLHDRQHPHDLFMELAAMYQRPINPRLAYQLYGALAGEPTLGPVAYPHRTSAMPNPLAPVTHHWLDSTHIAFGVDRRSRARCSTGENPMRTDGISTSRGRTLSQAAYGCCRPIAGPSSSRRAISRRPKWENPASREWMSNA